MDSEETQEVVSRQEHKYAEVSRPAGTRYHAEKRYIPTLVHIGLVELAPPADEVAPKKAKRRVK